jgi:hypothetical protein
MVAAVSVEVCAVELLKVSEVGERLHVVGLVAPEGAVVIAQESATVPVNEFVGVTVMVDVPLAPWATVMLVGLLERVKLVLPLGASQKFPQPAKPAASGAAASNNPAHLPIFIAAPRTQYSGCNIHKNQTTGYTRAHSPALCQTQTRRNSLAASGKPRLRPPPADRF